MPLHHLAVAIASGKAPFRYFEACDSQKVIYVDWESGTNEIVRRTRLLAVGLGADPERVQANLKLFAQDWPPQLDRPAATLSVRDPEAVRDFHREVRKFRPAAVILDTYIALFGGDENDNTQAREWYNSVIAPIRRDPRTAVVLAHHFNKDQGKLMKIPCAVSGLR